MDSTADVKAGVVMTELGIPAVVITSMDVSKIPVELTEEVVSAEVVPRVCTFYRSGSIFYRSGCQVSTCCRSGCPGFVLSTEVVVVSAEVVPSVVISVKVV